MAAKQGASLRAALIYLHAIRERDQAIAVGMGQMLREARKKRNWSRSSCTERARRLRSDS
jgi:hypothetical protein